jgi:hypothetical protein
MPNVREDGTISPRPAPNWKSLNTFRVNCQVENGVDCSPPPPNPKQSSLGSGAQGSAWPCSLTGARG